MTDPSNAPVVTGALTRESRLRRGPRGVLTPGPLHALIRDADGASLRHYERALDRPDRTWVRGEALSADAGGAAALVASGGMLHALVPEADGIAHLTRPLAGGAWQRRPGWLPGSAVTAFADGRALRAAVTGAGGVTLWRWDGAWQRGFEAARAADAALARRAFVAVVDGELVCWRRVGDTWSARPTGLPVGDAPAALVADAGGWLLAVPYADAVATWRIDASGTPTRHATLTWGGQAVDGVSLLAAGGGSLHALTGEAGSVHEHRRVGADGAWRRVACLRLHDTSPWTEASRPSVKLAQITGDRDSQPTTDGRPRVTLSSSESTAGVRGTDLGVRIAHDGRDYLLFGDTHWRGRPWLTTRDSLARIEDRGPLPGLPGFTVHGAPLRVRGGGVTLREYDVPLDAFSHDGDLYGFFSSDHFSGGQVMGRSVLAVHRGPLSVDPRSRRPVDFRHLRTFSRQHFINVSVQRLPGTMLGRGDADVIAVWGAGSYRAGDLRLAVLDPDTLGVRYWAGADEAGAPVWAAREADARPLLLPGAFGEISVRWVPEAGEYWLLSCSGPEDPIGLAVTLRTSPTPWGPWSERVRLLDWVAGGMSFADAGARFIKALADGTDPVGDRIFRGQADATGAAYAPYLFDVRAEADALVVRYTLSTWNPYQVVLMEHRLPRGGDATG